MNEMKQIKPNKKILLVLLIIIIAGAITIWHYMHLPTNAITAEGSIEATNSIIRSETSGIVQKIYFDEGQQVSKNSVLAIVEQTNAALLHSQVADQLSALQAQLDDLKNGSRPEQIAQAAATLGVAQAQLEKATSVYENNKKSYERNQSLFNAGGTSQQALDSQKTLYLQSQADMQGAVQQVTNASENLKLLKKGPTQDAIHSLEAKVAEAKSKLAGQQLALNKTEIRTGTAGTVSSRLIEIGELVSPGTAIANLLDLTDLKITCYIPATFLAKISLGEQVKVKVMGIPNKTFAGRITNIASEAEFTPLNKQTGDDRADLVFAVKVKLLSHNAQLRPGIPADITFPGSTK